MAKDFKDKFDPATRSEKAPWSFNSMPYDQRSSCFINVGTSHGEGYRQPVGKEKAELSAKSCPMGVKRFNDYDHTPNTIEILENKYD